MNRTQMQSLNYYCSLLAEQGTSIMLAGRPNGPLDVAYDIATHPSASINEALLTALHRLAHDTEWRGRRVFLTISRQEGAG